MAQANDDTVFKDLNAEDAEQGTTEIESCCMNCYENVSEPPPIALIAFNSKIVLIILPGYDSFAVDQNSILQRNYFDVIHVRPLRLRE